MLSHNDLKKGVQFIYNGQPFEVLDYSFVFKGRGSSVVQAKIKNLVNGTVLAKTFHPGESFEEAEIKKINAKFIYCHRHNFVFCRENNPSERFQLTEEAIGPGNIFLKPGQLVQAFYFNNQVINISLPIKVCLKVTEAPPGLKGDRSQSGNKVVKLESGAEINAPLFIEAGDIIEVNTEKSQYVRRVE